MMVGIQYMTVPTLQPELALCVPVFIRSVSHGQADTLLTCRVHTVSGGVCSSVSGASTWLTSLSLA